MSTKSALITGCSTGGIGHALAKEFASRGIHVFATARTVSKMADLKDNPNITLLSLDVTSATSIAAAVDAIQAKTGGKLDFLVNNAGVPFISPVLDASIADAKAVFDTNVWGMVSAIQAFAPLLIAAKGTIVNISSVGKMTGLPWMGLYGASKGAMDIISDVLVHELGALGVKVQTVVTGLVYTKIFDNAGSQGRLPETSYYKAAQQQILDKVMGKDLPPGGMSAEEYAKRVVVDALAGKTGHTYRGGLATMSRLVFAWLPFLVPYMAVYNTGLDKVKASMTSSGGKK